MSYRAQRSIMYLRGELKVKERKRTFIDPAEKLLYDAEQILKEIREMYA